MFNLDTVWEDAKQQLGNQWNQFRDTAAPTIRATLERAAIDELTKQNQKTQQEVNRAMGRLLDQPSTPLSRAASETLKPAVFEKYGQPILWGALGLVLIGFVIARGK